MGTHSQPPADRAAAAAARVHDALARAATPLTGAQIAAQTGLSVQAVRHHLRAMQQAGTAYVTPARVEGAAGRGRPARTWSLRQEADSGALAQVARVLATLIDAEPGAELLEQLAQLGAALAHDAGPGRDPLMAGLARLGFSPRAVGEVDGRACIELDSCPFFDPARGVTDTRICRVHRQLAAGMTNAGHRVDELEIDPRGVGCRLFVTPSDG